MTAAAYRHADGGKYSSQIRLLQYIDRFGVEAVMGRKQLYAGEMRRMIHAENIVNAYRQRNQMEAAEFVKENPDMSRMLLEAQKMVEAEDAT